MTDHQTISLKRPKTVCLYAALFVGFLVLRLSLRGLWMGWDPGLYPDGGLHYVTGVMAKDYLGHHLGQNPFTFIAGFHEQIPFVSLGLWPPLFYGVEGLWMAIFSASRFSVITFDAAIVAGASVTLFHYAGSMLTKYEAGIAGLILCLTPQFLVTKDVLVIDIFTAVFIFLAVMQFAKFLCEPTAKRAWIVGLFCVLAMLAKGTAMSLALCLPIALLMAGKLSLLQNFRLWIVPVVIMVFAGPWYLLTSAYSSQGFRYTLGADYTLLAIPEYSGYIFSNMGIVGLGFALVGVWSIFFGTATPKQRLYALAMISIVLGSFLFQVLMPVALQERYIAVLYMPLVVFAVKGVVFAVQNQKAWKAVLLAAVTVNAVVLSFFLSAPAEKGVPEVATVLTTVLPETGAPILLVGSAEIEALAATELLMGLPRSQMHGTYLVRGAKLLGGGGYNDFEYVPKFQTAADVRAEIAETGIHYAVFEISAQSAKWEHNLQFQQMLENNPGDYEILRDIDISKTRRLQILRLNLKEAGAVNTQMLREINQNSTLQAMKAMFGGS